MAERLLCLIRLSLRCPARHPTDMSNGSERSVLLDRGATILREVVRVGVSFSLLFITYLASGIPYGVNTDPGAPFSMRAHAGQLESRVVAHSLWSQALGIRKQFVVYLPPSYASNPSRRYPVAYYLHGMWGDEWNWVRAGHIDQTLDSLVARGGTEMIVIMPDGDDGWYTTWNNLGNNVDCRKATPP